MPLTASYNLIRNSLEAQIQGTCGVFSCYYAMRLLDHMDGAGARPVPAPRSRFGHVPGHATFAGCHSMRHFSKSLGSAQGEILNQAEMVRVVTHFGFTAHPSGATDLAGKMAFVSAQLGLQRPVLVPFWANGRGDPVETDTSPGAHWSLIIGEAGANYNVINPHRPWVMESYGKNLLMKSNANVDGAEYGPYYAKTTRVPSSFYLSNHNNSKPIVDSLSPHTPGRTRPAGSMSFVAASTDPKAAYNLYVNRAKGFHQQLAHVLIGVS